MKTAIITLTKGGIELGVRLRERLDDSELFVPEKYNLLANGKGTAFSELKVLVEKAFSDFDGLVLIMATGIVVRTIAPFIKGKDVDPAVVVMDEAGRHSISLLSGHLGGANELAIRVARAVGADPVITTATDVCGKSCAEDIAKELGCEIGNVGMIKAVNAAFLHDEPVSINLSRDKRERLAGRGNFVFYDSLDEFVSSMSGVGIAITNRKMPEIVDRFLIFRPKNLVVGVGCNRNTGAQEIEDVALKVLADAGLSSKCIRNLASIDVKNDEKGLLEFAEKAGLGIEFFSKEELEKVKIVSAPSAYVMEAVGVGGVCEPAAMLSAKNSRLLVAKVKSGNVTVAVAETEE